MQIATVHIKQQLECDCCTGNKEVELCPLENCNYPLCKNCKKKWLASKTDDRCPGCRRDIAIKIKPEKHIVYYDDDDDVVSEDYDDDDFDELKCPCSTCKIENNCNTIASVINNIFNFILSVAFLTAIILGIIVLSMFGRLVYMMLFPYPYMGFWCEISPLPVLFYLATSIVGLMIGFCGICILTCILQSCKSEDYGSYD